MLLPRCFDAARLILFCLPLMLLPCQRYYVYSLPYAAAAAADIAATYAVYAAMLLPSLF